jgi:amidase
MEPDSDLSRRSFLVSTAAAGALHLIGSKHEQKHRANRTPIDTTLPDDFPLLDATVDHLQDQMRAGALTSRSITQAYVDRIKALDQSGPGVNAVIELNPDAMATADELDAERHAKGPRGPLHGIPILIKDNIATHDRMQTTAGSLALVDSAPPRDAFLVERLRAAGAVILGKTNLSEWANFRSTHSTSGWSGRGGQTRNPYALDRNPSGSSSGSAAACAASFCAAAIGSETDGSIVSPSSCNSLVGLKPTIGLVSRSGIVPISHSQDTAGPICRTVRDAAILLGAIAGVDARDSATATAKGHVESDYTKALDPRGLSGARIGIARSHFFGADRGMDQAMEDAIDVLRKSGATIIDPVDLRSPTDYGDAEQEVLLYEFKADLNKYLADLGASARVRSLADVIAFNDAHRDTELRYFGQELMHQAESKGPLTSAAYLAARAKCVRLSRTLGIDHTMGAHRLDAIVLPTNTPAAPIDLVNGDGGVGGLASSSSPAAVAGYPSITVPIGYVFGLPVGMSFIGRPFTEGTLLKLAYAYETAAQVRKPPRFLATADVGFTGHPTA